jgi:hypothetical protein
MNVITGADFTEAMYEPLKSIIITTLITHFYTKNCDGSQQQLEAHEFEDYDLRAAVSLLRDIKRRVDGNDYLTMSPSNRAKVTAELMRISWSTGKLPTILAWYGNFICDVLVVFVSCVYSCLFYCLHTPTG